MRPRLRSSLSSSRLLHGLAASAFVAGIGGTAAPARAQAAPAPAPSGDANDEGRSGGAVPAGGAGAVVVPAQPPPAAPRPGASGVTPPRIVHFEPAPYPKEALDLGISGDVILQLDIDREGKVTAATVVQGLGHGLDEAAAQAARAFLFEPARRGGKPIPARILYRYAFTLTPKEPEPDKTAQPAAPQENLRGVVLVAGSDAPIAGATVTVQDDKGLPLQTSTTDEQGRWHFAGLAPGKYAVQVRSAGFGPLTVTEQIDPNEATEVTYRLAPDSGGIEVTVRGERPPREVTRRTLERREIERIPGTSGDALKSLQSLPGVARPPGLSGLLIVRGSAPQDTQTFVDGTFVPLVYHFGGLSSVVPTELLDRIDFYPGNFSAQYGRVQGGIVDVGIRSPNKDGKYHGMAQVDLIDARLVAEGPVPLLKNWSFIVAGRRSWVDVWLKPVLEKTGAGVTAAPVYYDYQAFLENHPTSTSTLRFGMFGSDDRFAILIKDPPESNPGIGGNLDLHTGFWRAQALFRDDPTPNLRYTASIGYGPDNLDFGIGSLYFHLTEWVLNPRVEFTARASPGVTVHTGLDIGYIPYEVDIRAPPPPRPGEPSAGPFITRPPITLTRQDSLFYPAAYAELELTPNERLKLVPGARVDYANDTKHWDLSPRFNARYDIVHDFPRTTLKGGVGLFHQPPQPQESVPLFGTPGALVSNRAVHYSLGVEQEFTRRIELSAEGFYKDLDNQVARVPTSQGAANGGFVYNNLGKGHVIGGEILLKYKADARFFGWLAYTLSRSIVEQPPDFTPQLFQYDQTHILTVLGSYKLGHGWEFGARFRLVSGSLYTPVVGGILSGDSGTYVPVQGPAYSQRLPLFHQLDLRVDKTWKFADWRLSAYLDVQNAYNRANPEGVTYNYNFSQQQQQAFLPIIPSLGIRAEL